MYLIIAIILLIISFVVYHRRASRRLALRRSLRYDSGVSPHLRISVVVDGGKSIHYIASLLREESPAFEVVVVSDFERDEAVLLNLIKYFGLFPVSYSSNGELPAGAVKLLYRSYRRLYSRLMVVFSPVSSSYTPFEVGATVSSYDYNLQIQSPRTLRPTAIEDLLLELSLREEGSIDEVTSLLGERMRLITRERALPQSMGMSPKAKERRIRIGYKILN